MGVPWSSTPPASSWTRARSQTPQWLKPLKFSLSIGIYSLSLAWLIGRLPSGARARIGTIAGTNSAVGLAIEMVIIDGFALVGQSSHFNLSTALHAAMWHVMAASISAVWVMTFVVAALLFRAPLEDAGRALDIRAGAVIALAGMALAFLMTGPKAGQVSDYPGLAERTPSGVRMAAPGSRYSGGVRSRETCVSRTSSACTPFRRNPSSCSCSNFLPGSYRQCRTPDGVCGSFCWLASPSLRHSPC